MLSEEFYAALLACESVNELIVILMTATYDICLDGQLGVLLIHPIFYQISTHYNAYQVVQVLITRFGRKIMCREKSYRTQSYQLLGDEIDTLYQRGVITPMLYDVCKNLFLRADQCDSLELQAIYDSDPIYQKLPLKENLEIDPVLKKRRLI